MLLLLGFAVGCQGATKAPVRPGVDYVVADPRAAFDRIRAGTIDLSSQAARALAPLLAARTFAAPSDPANFGLDRPQLTLSYLRGGAVVVTVDIGASNFDGHGYYVRRAGDPRVFLVLRDVLVPVFREVGITPAPVPDGS
ncbi:MAG: hypothetical protein NVS1B12_00050 [Acidimicrobiales bacterium]